MSEMMPTTKQTTDVWNFGAFGPYVQLGAVGILCFAFWQLQSAQLLTNKELQTSQIMAAKEFQTNQLALAREDRLMFRETIQSLRAEIAFATDDNRKAWDTVKETQRAMLELTNSVKSLVDEARLAGKRKDSGQ